jgi:hypothetical protein
MVLPLVKVDHQMYLFIANLESRTMDLVILDQEILQDYERLWLNRKKMLKKEGKMIADRFTMNAPSEQQ